MKKLSRKDVEEKIKYFFSSIKSKTPEDVKKIKKLSMRYGFKLKDLRKKFCKKCLAPYSGKEKIKVHHKINSVECKKCGTLNRWKIKLS